MDDEQARGEDRRGPGGGVRAGVWLEVDPGTGAERVERRLDPEAMLWLSVDGNGWGRTVADWLASADARPDEVCQVVRPGRVECPVQESGGLWCEVRGPHTIHQIGQHTSLHDMLGNGVSCTTVPA